MERDLQRAKAGATPGGNGLADELIGFDHLMLACRELDEVRDAYRRLGFTVTPYRTNEPMGGGTTGGRGGNHLVLMTPTDGRLVNYLELAYADPAHAAPFMRELLGRPPGLAMMVHAGRDLAAINAQWQAAGLPACDLYELDKPYRDPETGRVDRIHFRVLVPTARQGPLAVNAYATDDPSHYLREDWRTHGNGARHWADVAVAVDDVAAAAAFMTRVYGQPPESDDGGVRVTMGAQRLRVLDQARFAAALPGDVRDRRDGTLADTAITICVASIGRARSVLRSQDVDIRDDGAALVIPAREAAGVVLRFCEEA